MSLTFPTDKLIALSAIAQVFGERWQLSYLNGQWKERIPRDLLWCVLRPQRCRLGINHLPSWSWASVVNRVSYGNPLQRTETLPVLARLIECETVNPASLDNETEFFQESSRVALVLQGLIRPVTWKKWLPQPMRNSRLDYVVASESPDRPCHQYWPDTEDSDDEDDDDKHSVGGYPRFITKRTGLFCFLIYGCTDSSYREGGLVLEPYGDKDGDYTRVGHFGFHKSFPYDENVPDSKPLFRGDATDIQERVIRIF